MNINTNIYKNYVDMGRSYQKKDSSFASALEKAAAASGGKQDLFSMSSAASVFKENGREIKRAAEEISEPASEEKIAELKSRILGGRYNISSSQVADSILNRWV